MIKGSKTLGLLALALCIWLSTVPAHAQSITEKNDKSSSAIRPLLQNIEVQEPAAQTSLVKKTGSSTPVISNSAPALSAVRTSYPILAETLIPGYSGVLVETLDGDVVVESGSDTAFNPASNVKIATAYAVLKTFGPSYRFPTSVWTDGSYEESTGTI